MSRHRYVALAMTVLMLGACAGGSRSTVHPLATTAALPTGSESASAQASSGAPTPGLTPSLTTVAPAHAAGGVRLAVVSYDSPGADTGTNSSLNAEWFTITNSATTRRDMSGWKVREPRGHAFRFPTGYFLGAGKTVKVHTGRGISTALDRYWGLDVYVWNNDRGRVTLKTPSGTKIDTCSWYRAGRGSITC